MSQPKQTQRDHPNEIASLTKDRDAWKACAEKLHEALDCASMDCRSLHHPKKHRHEIGDDCPVVQSIRDALADFDRLKVGK